MGFGLGLRIRFRIRFRIGFRLGFRIGLDGASHPQGAGTRRMPRWTTRRTPGGCAAVASHPSAQRNPARPTDLIL